ncbi:Uncharacterised protein [Corynebacterium kutscheri]|uniref:SDR-like Ig domain-containing protein n=1 Tax=Corynebacterium kutscheri TaxID=35755 RepID=A0AB38VPT7_9CORY|nr:Ig-like domain-containing protein [Corynebacterium kutscheri]VEH04567.1 Uncharacterised protein [Corynebacterium kutscheri]VEH80371.1 Uncharacterised protein [Corynebacterium kutscheri]
MKRAKRSARVAVAAMIVGVATIYTPLVAATVSHGDFQTDMTEVAESNQRLGGFGSAHLAVNSVPITDGSEVLAGSIFAITLPWSLDGAPSAGDYMTYQLPPEFSPTSLITFDVIPPGDLQAIGVGTITTAGLLTLEFNDYAQDSDAYLSGNLSLFIPLRHHNVNNVDEIQLNMGGQIFNLTVRAQEASFNGDIKIAAQQDMRTINWRIVMPMTNEPLEEIELNFVLDGSYFDPNYAQLVLDKDAEIVEIDRDTMRLKLVQVTGSKVLNILSVINDYGRDGTATMQVSSPVDSRLSGTGKINFTAASNTTDSSYTTYYQPEIAPGLVNNSPSGDNPGTPAGNNAVGNVVVHPQPTVETSVGSTTTLEPVAGANSRTMSESQSNSDATSVRVGETEQNNSAQTSQVLQPYGQEMISSDKPREMDIISADEFKHSLGINDIILHGVALIVIASGAFVLRRLR